MEKKIVKAEILWTRKCPLSCSYCAMATGEGNSKIRDFWLEGMDVLKMLDCEFAAFYGAEPLADFENLPEVMGYAEDIGIATTLITSGQDVALYKKLQKYIECGGRSLSMSYDMIPIGAHSDVKMQRAEKALTWFKEECSNVRDVAAIATVTRTNFKALPDTIKKMSDKGIWMFFDLIHPDRGQRGSKCAGSNSDLLILPEDIGELNTVLEEVISLKKQGYLVHASEQYIRMLFDKHCTLLMNYNWQCGRYKEFPSWVTVNPDGKVLYCDDYQEKGRILLTDLYEKWERFVLEGVRSVTKCRGCAWNTHIDAHAIKAGTYNIGDYVHGK